MHFLVYFRHVKHFLYRYEEEHARPHWPEHYRRDVERDRHTASSRDYEPERDDERKYRSSRRREADRSKCCCPDRDMEFQQGGRFISFNSWPTLQYFACLLVRYGSGRFSAPQRHEKKLQQQQQQHEEHHYYSRDSQESLWDDEYGMERDDPYLHYATTAKRNWKRPSSASEMERKAAERSRQPYLAAGELKEICSVRKKILLYATAIINFGKNCWFSFFVHGLS